MTRVCLLGDEGVDLRVDLLSYETARGALSSYDLEEPYENTVCVETISIGAAVSLLNDLDWYLVRLVDEAIVLEPSVSEAEWLSRDLATAVRNEERDPAATGRYLKVYGVDVPSPPREEAGDPLPCLTDPMFVQRVDGEVPEYDLHEVEETLVVRVTEDEFGGR